jgi:sulfate adenylyltransferase large subunit
MVSTVTITSPEAGVVAGTAMKSTGFLRFITAGSVDDGKSTMIGRLLYDARSVYEDQLISIQKSGVNRADGPIDFSLLTDGLRAEREQGITIDVAYRYFSTARRKFIIADTPGHEQYTRNMVTGASTADAAIILIDARKGLLTQSRRHTYIAARLGIQNVIAAINKMDLVGYREEVFSEIAHNFQNLARHLGVSDVYAIPISALKGDNIVVPSERMPWFDGPPLLEHLENVPARSTEPGSPLRLPVQYVIRPGSHFRGFAGQVASGRLQSGATVVALPSAIKTRVKSITTFNGELEQAEANHSITFTLEDEIDLSRGDLLVGESDLPQTTSHLAADLVWLHPDPGQSGHDYLLKHTTRMVRARLRRIHHRVDMNTLEHVSASALQMNDIASVDIETSRPLFFDPYRHNRTTGSFILVDPISNATVAAGMIQGSSEPQPSRATVRTFESSNAGIDAPVESTRTKQQPSAAVWITGRTGLAKILERTIQEEGWQAQLVSQSEFTAIELKAVATILQRRAIVTIVSLPEEDIDLRGSIAAIFGQKLMFTEEQSAPDAEVVSSALDWLRSIQKQAKREEVQ